MPPSKYFAQRTRCFSYRLIPGIGSEEEEDMEQENSDEQPDEQPSELFLEVMKEKILNFEAKAAPIDIVEKDKMTLIKLFDAVADLNGILKEVYSKKLQYQKG